MTDVQEVAQTPFEMTKEGQRHIVVGEYSLAVEVLAKACEQIAQKYGEKADECAEPYYWYGKALLALSREERGVLGGVMSVSAANDGEEENNEDEKVDDKEEKSDEDKVEGDKADDGEVTDESKEKGNEESAEKSKETKTDEAEPSTSNGEKGEEKDEAEEVEEESDEDEVENLQLAWEMLELSRGILQQRNEDSRNSLLADVLLCLGEVALESETYDKAVSDMKSCLEIQKKLYDSNDRRIAETHYQIGLANSLASNFDDSITHYQNAVNILESCIKLLEDKTDEDSRKDIQQIRELIPEIQEKIQDVMECKTETKNALRETLCPTNGASSSNGAFASSSSANGSSGSSTNGPFSSSNGPASSSQKQAADISHLVKRKRKSSGGEELSAPKRTNTE